MAKITFNLGEEYMRKLQKLGDRSDEITKPAVHEGARIVANQIRANLEANLAGSEESTGALEASMGITKMDVDKQGVVNVKIGFNGYDEKGVPNELKANVMEHGSSKVKKRPFIRPAVNATKKEAEAAMGKIVEEKIKEIMEE